MRNLNIVLMEKGNIKYKERKSYYIINVVLIMFILEKTICNINKYIFVIAGFNNEFYSRSNGRKKYDEACH